jgi:hypothetical protein
MSELESTEKHNTELAQLVVETPIVIPQDDPQQDPAYHVLYILGFGIAGAIVTNMTLLLYFVSLHASG